MSASAASASGARAGKIGGMRFIPQVDRMRRKHGKLGFVRRGGEETRDVSSTSP